VNGDGEGQTLFNAVTGDEIFRASSKGLDFAAMAGLWKKNRKPCNCAKMISGKRKNVKALCLTPA